MDIIRWDRDAYGRRYLNIGKGLFCIGFGPVAFIERVWVNNKVIYCDHEALREGQRRRGAR